MSMQSNVLMSYEDAVKCFNVVCRMQSNVVLMSYEDAVSCCLMSMRMQSNVLMLYDDAVKCCFNVVWGCSQMF